MADTRPLRVDGFPGTLHRRLRRMAADQDTTMKRLVIDMVEDRCAEHEERLERERELSAAGNGAPVGLHTREHD